MVTVRAQCGCGVGGIGCWPPATITQLGMWHVTHRAREATGRGRTRSGDWLRSCGSDPGRGRVEYSCVSRTVGGSARGRGGGCRRVQDGTCVGAVVWPTPKGWLPAAKRAQEP